MPRQPNPLEIELVQRLKRARTESGFTRKNAARFCGIRGGTYNNIEDTMRVSDAQKKLLLAGIREFERIAAKLEDE